ncbi:MAG TPA: ABC transporter substrate-binding protein [Phototrophicaceae bacterium]|nr:ABC transporter substrate-binding protein [Phototrophicaceae bacterium]
MKSIGKFLLLGLALLLVSGLVLPVMAQDKPAPGEGGILIEGNFGGDPASFNPILASDTASSRITLLSFPGFIGVDPATALFEKGRADALALDWTISEDGLTYTFTLRDDWKWSDGTPITSKDIVYGWKAALAGAEGIVDTSWSFVVDSIESVEAPDDYTVVATMKENNCAALNNIGVLNPVPSHVLPEDLALLNDDPFNTNPTVSGGVFKFVEFRPAEAVSLEANQEFSGATNGEVLPAGFIYKVVPDQTVLVEQFIAGETNVIDGPPVNRRDDLLADENLNMYNYPGNAWDYLMLNLADPTNPQNGQDEAGNPIDQGHHPLFGDVRVREAIAKAINVDDIIQGAVFGHGERMTSVIIPASWAYAKDLPPIGYDPEAAKALLDEAGWVDDDNNVDTPRVCKGCEYAEEGTPFNFVLYTNEGNTRRGAVGTITQDQLKQIGLGVDFQAIDFNTLLDIMDGQTYDAVILGWRNGYPDDPDLTQLFTPAGDVVGGGSNNASYYNPEMVELNAQARSLPGCDPAARAEIYAKIQEIMQKDLPYVPLYAINGMYGASAGVEGFGPYPSQLYWNVDTWYLATP